MQFNPKEVRELLERVDKATSSNQGPIISQSKHDYDLFKHVWDNGWCVAQKFTDDDGQERIQIARVKMEGRRHLDELKRTT